MSTDDQLRDLLHRTADDVPVGPPPTTALVRRGRRSRLRRRVVPLVATVAVLVVALVAGGWLGSDDRATPTTVDPAGPGPSDLVETAPGPRLGSGTDVPISTSAWQPGDGGRLALIAGTLKANDAGCLHVGGSDIVWPAGFTATTPSPGTVQVRRPDGAVVAETGRTFRTVGSWASPAGGLVCRASTAGEVATVQGLMRPLEGRPAQTDVDAAQGPTAAERSLVTQLVSFAAGSRSTLGTELPLPDEVSLGLGNRIGAGCQQTSSSGGEAGSSTRRALLVGSDPFQHSTSWRVRRSKTSGPADVRSARHRRWTCPTSSRGSGS